MLTLSSDTIARLDQLSERRVLAAIADWLLSAFPAYFTRIGAPGPEAVTGSLRIIQSWAADKALLRNKDIRMLGLMSLTQGVFFQKDPRFSAALTKTARQHELPPDERLDGIFAAFDTWRKEVAGLQPLDSMLQRAARLIAGEVPGALGSAAEIVDYILPGQAAWAGPKVHHRFMEAVLADGQRWALPTRQHFNGHIALSAFLGYRWMEDPKLAAFAAIIATDPDPRTMSARLSDALIKGIS